MTLTPTHESVEVYYDNGYRTLRALRDFHQGEHILNLPSNTLKRADRLSIEVVPGVHLDCSESPAGAINHSCEPNAAVRKTAIVAWNCINEADEIKIDYKKTERILAAPFNCNCGSKNCRGWIE